MALNEEDKEEVRTIARDIVLKLPRLEKEEIRTISRDVANEAVKYHIMNTNEKYERLTNEVRENQRSFNSWLMDAEKGFVRVLTTLAELKANQETEQNHQQIVETRKWGFQQVAWTIVSMLVAVIVSVAVAKYFN